ncbi:hypothetical protein K2173_016705 [Erythroxylum novogranatense]|uniref:polynucleotide adenylyltransferase n=1 Tax=Erythroxylum novogranatense TaxID=1862640 RepID=A0AAV8SS08_9ROSI|nr:hypothetical protein K2173_016705 [Erythroxylum novogranatense]
MELPTDVIPSVPLYDTLTLNPNYSPHADSFETYTVFRNEISLSAAPTASLDAAAPNFLSLDIAYDDGDAVDDQKVQIEKVEPVTPLAATRMEGAWFIGCSNFRSPMMQLHKEIVDFCDFLSPTPEEQASRNTAVEGVSDLIKYIWPNCKVEVFGSFRTGLYLPTSDIDVVILDSGIKTPQVGLQALSRALSVKGVAKKIQVIAKARVPIVKFVEKNSGVSFDISFDVDNGPKAAEFIRDAVSKIPPLRPLCLILKVFLQQRELNEVYSGGISSYALLVMLMAMLQSLAGHQPSPEQNLGVLLIHFFDFYGRKLNIADVGVSCKGAGIFFSKRTKGFTNKGRPFLIAIEDPQAPENDIGKNSFNYFQIRSAFAMAYSTLTNPKIILSLGPNRSILGTIIRPDPLLLERKGGYNGGLSFNSLIPGAGEPLQMLYDNEEILDNWQFDEEEALPRGNGIAKYNSGQSTGKKRKASTKEKCGKKKSKENGEVRKAEHEKNNLVKEKGMKKKQRWRHTRDNANGFVHYVSGSPYH